MILLADSEGPDKTECMISLISAFPVCICPKTCFRMARPIWYWSAVICHKSCWASLIAARSLFVCLFVFFWGGGLLLLLIYIFHPKYWDKPIPGPAELKIWFAFENSIDPDQLANWSGSALFVIQYVTLYKKSGLSNLIGWQLTIGVAS